MAHGLKIKKYAIKNANYNYLRVFRLRVEVDETTGGMDPYVFMYRQRPADPFTNVVLDEFIGTASPVDLSDYPAGAPDPALNMPFFRRSYFELDIRSQTEAEAVYQTVVTELNHLCLALDKAQNLQVVDTLWLGDAPPDAAVSESLSYPSEGL